MAFQIFHFSFLHQFTHTIKQILFFDFRIDFPEKTYEIMRMIHFHSPTADEAPQNIQQQNIKSNDKIWWWPAAEEQHKNIIFDADTAIC